MSSYILLVLFGGDELKYKIGIILDLKRGLGQYLINNLKTVLSDQFEYEVFYTDALEDMTHCDVILVMIKEKVLKVLPYVKKSDQVITVKRTLTYVDIEKVSRLSGDVLVVNDNEQTTLDLVITLHKLGLNHVNWVPFYNNHFTGIQSAVTAYESHLVPQGLEVVDIGFRPIDVSTIIDILQYLNLNIDDYADDILKYEKRYMPLDPKLVDQVVKTRDLNRLKQVVDNTNKASGHISYYDFKDIVTQSEQMIQMIEKAEKLAKHDINVLIIGESGTGKELIAQGIHQASYRRDLPFVGVNVTAIPHNLLESELFGYAPGAFTGASKTGYKGLFEQVAGGTLFLDEIGDLPLEMQGKLLRVLEEHCIRPVGSDKLVKINVRVVAATNKNLLKEIEAGRFREDLYYRLKASVLMIPALRHRDGDIDHLINHFIGDAYEIEASALYVLNQYPWKGNVRELKHACDYIKIMSDRMITMNDLPDDILSEDVEGIYLHSDKMMNVLKAINELSAKQPSVGRQSIVQHLNHTIGEGEIKTILKHLKQEGFILQGKGRKGSVITKKGQLVLSN